MRLGESDWQLVTGAAKSVAVILVLAAVGGATYWLGDQRRAALQVLGTTATATPSPSPTP